MYSQAHSLFLCQISGSSQDHYDGVVLQLDVSCSWLFVSCRLSNSVCHYDGRVIARAGKTKQRRKHKKRMGAGLDSRIACIPWTSASGGRCGRLLKISVGGSFVALE